MKIQELKNLIEEELIRAMITEEIGFSSNDTAEWGNFYTSGNGLEITLPLAEMSNGSWPMLELTSEMVGQLTDFLESHFQFSEAGDLELTKDPNILHRSEMILDEVVVEMESGGNLTFAANKDEEFTDSIVVNLVFDEVYKLYTFIRGKL